MLHVKATKKKSPMAAIGPKFGGSVAGTKWTRTIFHIGRGVRPIWVGGVVGEVARCAPPITHPIVMLYLRSYLLDRYQTWYITPDAAKVCCAHAQRTSQPAL